MSSMYDELIKSLRLCVEDPLYCSGCLMEKEEASCCHQKLMGQAAEALEELQKEQETERLIRLPCKPGDMAYYIRGGYVVGETVLKVVIDDSGSWVQVGPHRVFAISDFGKTAFTTVDAAEKVLKEAGS